jgi:exonuclease III
MDRVNQQFRILSWNVRGLNSVARQEEVKQVIRCHKPELICLQETKLALVDSWIICNIAGTEYDNNFCYLPATGTRGGIIIAANNSSYQIH